MHRDDPASLLNDKIQYFQENCFTLLIELLCFISTDKLANLPQIYYHPTVEVTNLIRDYIERFAISSKPTHSKVLNTSSKKLVKEIQEITYEKHASEDGDRDENGDGDGDGNGDGQRKEQNKNHSVNQNKTKFEEVKANEKEIFCCSLMMKLMISSSILASSSWGIDIIFFYLRRNDETLNNIVKTMLKTIKDKEIGSKIGANKTFLFWNMIADIINKFYEQEDLVKCVEIARMVCKIYFDKIDKLTDDIKKTLHEKFLGFLVDSIVFAVSSQERYNYLSIVNSFTNKNYLDAEYYKKLLAFFEVR